MDDQNAFKKFQQFLMEFLLKKAAVTLTDGDFSEQHSDLIWPLLENTLPTLSIPEVTRLKTYFSEVLSFYIKDALGQQTQISSQILNASSSIIVSSNSDVQPFTNFKPPEDDIQTGPREENTPFEDFTHRGDVGMIQSTPLSILIPGENQGKDLTDQQKYAKELDDPFVNDIISHINLSPIPQDLENPHILLNQNVNSSIQMDPSPIKNLENQSHSFLRNFAPLAENFKRRKVHREESNYVNQTKLPSIGKEQLLPKLKRKRISFEKLCNWVPKEVNLMPEEFVLYFPLMPHYERNLIKRATDSDAKGKEQPSVPAEKIINLSNVIRSHVSERQSSVEMPTQSSFLPSPCTPQNLLRTSQLQPFTPVRADASSQLLCGDTEQINFQTRSIIRQQPLVTIPERESLMPNLTNSLVEGVPLQSSLPDKVHELEYTAEVPGNPLVIDEENIHVGENDFQVHPPVHILSPLAISQLFEQHNTMVHVENLPLGNIPPHPIENKINDDTFNWFEILRPRLDVIYPNVGSEKRRKKTRKRGIERDTPPRSNATTQNAFVTNASTLPMIPDDNIDEQSTDFLGTTHVTQLQHDLRSYIKLIKENIRNRERTWEHFDPFLFKENDDFEMYTYILKRIIKDNFVPMSSLYNEGTSRMDAARGFRLLLELQTIGLIEISAIDTRIESFKLIS